MKKITFGVPAPISKIGPTSTDRTIAQAPKPAEVVGHGENRASVSTYFTRVQPVGEPTAILYNGDRMWAKVTVTLETAGPVAVGQLAEILPVLSGKGQLLQTGVPTSFDVAKGTRLYIASTGVNRVSFVVQAYPWLETLTGLATSILGALGSPVSTLASRLKT